MERMFEFNNVSDTKRFKHAISILVGYASSWWEKEKRDRNRNGDIAIYSWGFLRVIMRARFLLEEYVNDLLTKFYNMKQENKNAEAYFEELETTRVRANLDDNGRLIISKFLAGLKHEISRQMTLHKFVTIHEALQGAIKVENKLQEERQLKESKFKNYNTSWSKNKETWQSLSNENKPKVDSKWQNDKGKSKVEAKEGGNNSKLYFQNPNSNRCYKCQGYNHKMSECPNRRTIIFMEEAYEREESKESCEEEEAECDDEVESDTPNLPLYVVRRVLSAQVMEDMNQRENLFHGKCKIKDQVCSLIIDGGSCTNVASASMVDKLNLKTQRHTRPYKLQWLNKCGELKVTRQVLVSFKIEKYVDDILCDVVLMQACHLLLGRPCQYDKDTPHDGRTNKYSFEKNGKTIALLL
ncbi:uncharacterized protein [Nicotiana tomentosiformis]|uniref:uncharacterized protein n=1 Tax=Nicotiana tomentosiformis TaxID=4098 RepID=UPI00388C3BA2